MATLKTNIKHLEVSQRALRCVDVELISTDTDEEQEYASELLVQWQTAMYAIDTIREAFELAQYEIDNPD